MSDEAILEESQPQPTPAPEAPPVDQGPVTREQVIGAMSALQQHYEAQLAQLKEQLQQQAAPPPPQQDPVAVIRDRIASLRDNVRRKGGGINELLAEVWLDSVQAASALAQKQVEESILPRIEDRVEKERFFASRPDLIGYRQELEELVDKHGVSVATAVKIIEKAKNEAVQRLTEFGKDNPHFLAFLEEPNATLAPARKKISRWSLMEEILQADKAKDKTKMAQLIDKWVAR